MSKSLLQVQKGAWGTFTQIKAEVLREDLDKEYVNTRAMVESSNKDVISTVGHKEQLITVQVESKLV